ncbi:hypothetical protein L838_5138 [Mycobacterium avium MAV_120709_2344]|nr:hypothetical protein L838_5138 [Mycobacterium avium MAV_120709_2344]
MHAYSLGGGGIETCSSLVRSALTWPAGPDLRFGTTARRHRLACRRIELPFAHAFDHRPRGHPGRL